MNSFTITFNFHGKLFSSEVKKKKHESTFIYAVDLNHEYLQKTFNSKKLVFVEHVISSLEGNSVITLSQSVHYFQHQNKDAEFETILWKAIHEVFDTKPAYRNRQKQFPVFAW